VTRDANFCSKACVDKEVQLVYSYYAVIQKVFFVYDILITLYKDNDMITMH